MLLQKKIESSKGTTMQVLNWPDPRVLKLFSSPSISISKDILDSGRFQMNISSTNPSASLTLLAAAVNVPPEEAAQRRQLVHAAKSVNASGTLGENQLVFAVDPPLAAWSCAWRTATLTK